MNNSAEKTLLDRGVNLSYQRVKILEYLLEKKNHPTIDRIFTDLKPVMPKLSKTTIYNTLQQFVEKNVAQIISIENNETRYDADTSMHGHFKCEKCGAIYDFDYNINDNSISGLENFEVNQTHLYVKGVCKKCKTKIN